jgi:ornithine decarboxylase
MVYEIPGLSLPLWRIDENKVPVIKPQITIPQGSFEEVVTEFLLANPEESAYFLDSTHLRGKARIFLNEFMPEDSHAVTAYAMKANPNKQVLEILTKEGIDYFDCASPSEIRTMKGINSDAINLYNNPLKRKQDIVAAAHMGVKHFTVQTHREIQKVFQATYGIIKREDLEIAVRLQTLNDAAAINLSTKFGAPFFNVLEMFEHLKSLGVIPGISIHTGSQNSDPKTFHTGIEKIMDIIKKKGKINTLNIGGGIPVDYLGDRKYNIIDYLQVINGALRGVVGDIFDNDDYKLIIEPGRSMIGDSIKLVAPILSREKRGHMDSIYIHDGIFGSFNLADTPNVEAAFKILRQEGDRIIELPIENLKKFEVFGCSCDSADKLPNKMLPQDVREGDWILHETAGAYTSACRSNFNGYAEHGWIIY